VEIKQHILNSYWIKEEIRREFWKFFELNENKNKTFENL